MATQVSCGVRACTAVAVLALVVFSPRIAHGQTKPAPDALSVGLGVLHQLADSGDWVELAVTADNVSKIDGKVTYSMAQNIELTRAGDAYRILFDPHVRSGQLNLPLSTATFDGKVLRSVTVYREQKLPPQMAISMGASQEFMDLYLYFWPLLGVRKFERHLRVDQDFRTDFDRSHGGVLGAEWRGDDIEIHGELASLHRSESCTVSVKDKYVKHWTKQYAPDFILSLTTESTQEVGGQVVPKNVVYEGMGGSGKVRIEYKFTKFRLMRPDEVDVEKLVSIPEVPGMEVLDSVKHVAYRVTEKGPTWEPLYDPVTGRATVGPSTKPSPSTAPVTR